MDGGELQVEAGSSQDHSLHLEQLFHSVKAVAHEHVLFSLPTVNFVVFRRHKQGSNAQKLKICFVDAGWLTYEHKIYDLYTNLHGLLHNLKLSANLKQPAQQHSTHLCTDRPLSSLCAAHSTPHLLQKRCIHSLHVSQDRSHIGLHLAVRPCFLLLHQFHISNCLCGNGSGVAVVGEVGAEKARVVLWLDFRLLEEGSLDGFGGGGSVSESHGAIWLGGPLLHIQSVIFQIHADVIICRTNTTMDTNTPSTRPKSIKKHFTIPDLTASAHYQDQKLLKLDSCVDWSVGWVYGCLADNIYNSKQQLTMAEYDFEESIMCESVPAITVPLLVVGATEREGSIGGGVMMDLQRLIEEERAGEARRIQMLKQKQQHISEQVGRRLAQKQRKIRQLEEEQKRRLYSECTFKPKTTQKGEKRSLNEFLQQQDQFTRKVAQKRTTLKCNLDSQSSTSTFHPKINRPRNDKINEPSVFQRLYALKDKENTEDNQQDIPEATHHPRITDKSKRLARNTPIDNLLYNDALRRQERAREAEVASLPIRQEKPLNLNNEKYVAQKFIKEYFAVMEKLSVPSSAQAKIQYVLFNEILKEMGFAGIEEQGENSLERTLVHEAYQTLQKYQVNAKNICVFLLAIIGVYHINPVNFQEGEAPSPETEFALDEPEGRKLQKYFDLFKRNRLFGEATRKQAQKEQREAMAEQAVVHKPSINKQSQELAQRYREQMLQEVNELLQNYPEIDYSIPEDGVISHTDLLILNNLARQLKKQQKKEQASQKQLAECTFKPATLPSSMHSSAVSTGTALGHKKSLELYNYHRNLQNKKESLRLSRQNQDAQLKECTFAPTLNHAKVAPDTRNYHTKQVEEALYRMKKGRQDRQQKQQFLQRGQAKKTPKQHYSSLRERPQTDSEEPPTLLLDVNLGEKMDRITLYPGDEGRLEEIAAEFAGRHGLDAENREKLCQLLRIQLQSVLMRIEEDEESDNDHS